MTAPAKPKRKPTKKRKRASSTTPQRRRTRRPASLAGLLAEGLSYVAIAERLQVDRETVTRWSKHPEVQAELLQLQGEATSDSRRRLTAFHGTALDGLQRILTAGKCPECGRGSSDDHAVIKAAVAIFDRTGLPPQKEVTVHGGLTLSEQPDADLDREILNEAVEVLLERGFPDLAEQVRAVAKAPVPAPASSPVN